LAKLQISCYTKAKKAIGSLIDAMALYN